MSKCVWLIVVVFSVLSASCNREVEDPRVVGTRIANEVLANDVRLWYEYAGSSSVWTACRKGEVIVLVVDGATGTHKLLHMMEQAVCGLPMDQMAAATLRLQKIEPQLASRMSTHPDWLYWAAERSRLITSDIRR